MTQPDNEHGPFGRMLVLGDSIAYGMCAAEPANEWPQVTAALLRRFQDGPLEVLNYGLPAGVLSPRAPGYHEAAKPSLLERLEAHCIALRPDLVLVAEGLNDMRCGMPLADFMADLDAVAGRITAETDALLVRLGVYHQRYGCGANDPDLVPTWTRWTAESVWVYNEAIRLVAHRHGALFVDVQAVMNGADWLLNPDCCHLNDLGHVLVGHAVFQTLASHCSALAGRTLRQIAERDVSIANTGGADAGSEIKTLWAAAAARFNVDLGPT